MQRTNFRGVCVGVKEHAAAIWHSTSTTKEAVSYRFAGLHSLESKVSSHRLGDIVAVIAVLNALLGNVLYLGSSVYMLVKPIRCWAMSVRTCSGTRFALSAQSC